MLSQLDAFPRTDTKETSVPLKLGSLPRAHRDQLGNQEQPTVSHSPVVRFLCEIVHPSRPHHPPSPFLIRRATSSARLLLSYGLVACLSLHFCHTIFLFYRSWFLFPCGPHIILNNASLHVAGIACDRLLNDDCPGGSEPMLLAQWPEESRCTLRSHGRGQHVLRQQTSLSVIRPVQRHIDECDIWTIVCERDMHRRDMVESNMSATLCHQYVRSFRYPPSYSKPGLTVVTRPGPRCQRNSF